MNPINVTKPYLPHITEYTQILRRAWNNGVLTNGGELHNELQERLREYCGAPYLSLVCNGTMGLMLALKALDVRGSVLTSPYGFPATTHAVKWMGLKPLFTDSVWLDAAGVEDELSIDYYNGIGAVLGTHVYGVGCDERIDVICRKYKRPLIYDASHSFGTADMVRGDVSVCSFHATKIFNTFEGGCIITKSKVIYDEVERLKNFGFVDGEVATCGINAKMSEAHAAMGLLMLNRIDEAIEKRKRIAEIYCDGLGVALLCGDNYSYFPILSDNRDLICERLNAENIYPRKYFSTLLIDEDMPVAQRFADRVLCLPIYPDLKDEDVLRIIKIVKPCI